MKRKTKLKNGRLATLAVVYDDNGLKEMFEITRNLKTKKTIQIKLNEETLYWWYKAIGEYAITKGFATRTIDIKNRESAERTSFN